MYHVPNDIVVFIHFPVIGLQYVFFIVYALTFKDLLCVPIVHFFWCFPVAWPLYLLFLACAIFLLLQLALYRLWATLRFPCWCESLAPWVTEAFTEAFTQTFTTAITVEVYWGTCTDLGHMLVVNDHVVHCLQKCIQPFFYIQAPNCLLERYSFYIFLYQVLKFVLA